MSSQYHVDDRQSLVAEVLGDFDGPVLLVDPDVQLIEAVAEHGASGAMPTLRVLARENVLKAVRDDFLTATLLGDLVEAETVELRVLPSGTPNTLFLTETTLSAVVSTVGGASALGSDDSAFVADAHETYSEQFESAETFDLRTPGRERILDTLADRLGEPTADTVGEALEVLSTREDGGEVDGVALSLLVVAYHEGQLYEVSRWGEDIGMASKATFSRTKTDLEDQGYVTTEKVPVDVGRPRQRLLLTDGTVADDAVATLADLAVELE
ncbi:DUF5821 family protein [Halobaculum sp. MBLA0143]|uniref:transcriptional regulator TbsP domain-containing protein n=1 Tax=Halobaculum sp. MBLA0143 TaxID=3079933 RepID=UPI003524B9A6